MHKRMLQSGLAALLLGGAALLPLTSHAATVTAAATCPPVASFQRWLLSRPHIVDEHFGAALAIADFNHDGAGDLVVGAPQDLSGRARSGRVYLYAGSAAGPGAVPRPLDEGTPGGGDDFGAALATGDVNKDGYPDLVIGAPGRGTVTLFTGGPSGPVRRSSASAAAAALAVGDFNRDGYADVAAGVPGHRRGAGEVVVFPGSAAGLGAPVTFTQLHHGGADEPGDGFGTALAAGDFDGDGYTDLAVGAPGEAPGRLRAGGAVTVLRGSAHGLSGGTVLLQSAAGGAVERGDRFGAALAAGDLDGDHRADLLVGVPGEAPGRARAGGVAHLFPGGARGLTEGTLLRQEDGGGATASGDAFGTGLALADLDGDGKADPVIGAPGDAPGGAVALFGGGSARPHGRVVTEAAFGLTPAAGSRAGAGLAIGDLTGDGRPELVVAMPGMVVAGQRGAGAVRVAAGLSAGLASVAATAGGVKVVPTRATDVRVRYRPAGTTAWRVTPTLHTGGRPVTVALPGLSARTSYEYDVVVGCVVDPLSAGTLSTSA
jgi:hypothetical protein